MQFPSDRSLQAAVLENEGQLFIEGLPSIIIYLRSINANCNLFHTGCSGLTTKLTLCAVVFLLTPVPFTQFIHL